MVSSKSQQFIQESKSINYQQFFPKIYVPEESDLKEWNYSLPYYGKPQPHKFVVANFAYPDNPVDLMIAIADKHPYLVPDGYCLEINQKSIEYVIQRDWLFHPHFIAQFCDAYGWLRCLEPSNSYYLKQNTHSLKHACERTVRYVITGALVAAAFALGLKVQKQAISPRRRTTYPHIGVTSASARAADNYSYVVESYLTDLPSDSYNFSEIGYYKFWHFDQRLHGE